MELAQYKRATRRRLRSVLVHARSKLSAARRRYKSVFERTVSFRLVLKAGDFVFVSRLPCALTQAEMQDLEHLYGNNTDGSRKLLSESQGPYCVRLPSGTVVHIARDIFATNGSIYCITKAPAGRRPAQSSGNTGGKSESEATTTWNRHWG